MTSSSATPPVKNTVIITPADPTEDDMITLWHLIQTCDTKKKRAGVRVTLAGCFMELGLFDEAMSTLKLALADDPTSATAQKYMGLELYRRGQLHEGLPIYNKGKWQLEVSDKYKRPHTAPFWKGEALNGKKVLLWSEQGIGDSLMQSRVLHQILDMGTEITLETDPRHYELLGPLKEKVTFYSKTVKPHPELTQQSFDYQSSLFTAWQFVQQPLANPYHLVADQHYADQYQEIWSKMGGASKNVGLSWYSKNDRTGKKRSIELAHLSGLTMNKHARFHSLQYGDPDLSDAPQTFGAPIFSDPTLDHFVSLGKVASLISRLDLVITIDSTIAHLAGGLGVPTWLLLPKAADWRWGIDETSTQLYPNMRLFRSRDAHNWSSILPTLFDAFMEI